MEVSVSEAKAQLTELIHRAEAGEEVVLTRHGRAVVRIVPLTNRPSAAERRALLDEVAASSRGKITAGPSADRSQDFLYGGDGMPA